jgi:hypothetical protein
MEPIEDRLEAEAHELQRRLEVMDLRTREARHFRRLHDVLVHALMYIDGAKFAAKRRGASTTGEQP